MKEVEIIIKPKFTTKAHNILKYHIWIKDDGTIEGTTFRILAAMEEYGKFCFENARKGTENTIDFWKSYGANYETYEEFLQEINKSSE